MIDVVFLMLIFFMLAARFGIEETRDLVLPGAGAGADWQGPPRLVEVWADRVALNGVPLPEAQLPEALTPLVTGIAPGAVATILLRPRDGADVQRLLVLSDRLSSAGFAPLLIGGGS